MAAPKKKPTTATKGYTPKVNAATGFTTGVRTVKKANAISSKIKPVAPRGVSVSGRPKPAPTPKPKSLIDQAGDFLRNRADIMTGKIASPQSIAMRNPSVPTILAREKTKIAAVKARTEAAKRRSR